MDPPTPLASDEMGVQPAVQAWVQAASAGWVRRPRHCLPPQGTTSQILAVPIPSCAEDVQIYMQTHWCDRCGCTRFEIMVVRAVFDEPKLHRGHARMPSVRCLFLHEKTKTNGDANLRNILRKRLLAVEGSANFAIMAQTSFELAFTRIFFGYLLQDGYIQKNIERLISLLKSASAMTTIWTVRDDGEHIRADHPSVPSVKRTRSAMHTQALRARLALKKICFIAQHPLQRRDPMLSCSWRGFPNVKIELQQASNTFERNFAAGTCPLRVTWRGLPKIAHGSVKRQ